MCDVGLLFGGQPAWNLSRICVSGQAAPPGELRRMELEWNFVGVRAEAIPFGVHFPRLSFRRISPSNVSATPVSGVPTRALLTTRGCTYGTASSGIRAVFISHLCIYYSFLFLCTSSCHLHLRVVISYLENWPWTAPRATSNTCVVVGVSFSLGAGHRERPSEEQSVFFRCWSIVCFRVTFTSNSRTSPMFPVQQQEGRGAGGPECSLRRVQVLLFRDEGGCFKLGLEALSSRLLFQNMIGKAYSATTKGSREYCFVLLWGRFLTVGRGCVCLLTGVSATPRAFWCHIYWVLQETPNKCMKK